MQIATYAVQWFWNAFRWGEFVIAVMTKAISGFVVNAIIQFEKLVRKLKDYAYIFGLEGTAHKLEEILEKITGLKSGFEHAKDAADMWAEDTAVKIENTRNYFEGLRAKLEEIKNAQKEMGENITAEVASKYIEAHGIMGETSQDFINEEMERQLALQMFEKGLLDTRVSTYQKVKNALIWIEKTGVKTQLRTQAQYFNEIAMMLREHGKWAFRAYQALAIAETTMTTMEGAVAAYAWGWEYGGPIAPALAAAMMAVAIAAGMARVVQIASQKYEYAAGGWLAANPEGGWISQGGGVRDDVHLGGRNYGMSGEFVVNKNAAAENAALLEAINRGETIGGITIPITLELDGEILWRRTYRATRDGNLQIHEGALVSR